MLHAAVRSGDKAFRALRVARDDNRIVSDARKDIQCLVFPRGIVVLDGNARLNVVAGQAIHAVSKLDIIRNGAGIRQGVGHAVAVEPDGKLLDRRVLDFTEHALHHKPVLIGFEHILFSFPREIQTGYFFLWVLKYSFHSAI